MKSHADRFSAAPPPDGGARALLAFAALTAAVYIIAAAIFILIFANSAEGAEPAAAGSQVVSRWNKFCASVTTQGDALRALDRSLHANHPQRVIDSARLELYTRVIVESEKQTALLKAMRKAEFGVAGEVKGAGREDETPRNSVPALPRMDVAFGVPRAVDGRRGANGRGRDRVPQP